MAELPLDGSELIPLESGGAYSRVDDIHNLDPETRVPLTDGGLYVKVGEMIGTGGYDVIYGDYRRIPLLSGRQDVSVGLLRTWDGFTHGITFQPAG